MEPENQFRLTDDVERINSTLVSAFKDVELIKYIIRKIRKIPSAESEIDACFFDFKKRIKEHLNKGSLIYEAQDFNAVAIWYPSGTEVAPMNYPLLDKETLKDVNELLIKSREFKRRYFNGRKYWYLNTLARNMNEAPKEGSVSLLIKPVIIEAILARFPIYVEAITDHARDVYLHYGFNIIETVSIGKNKINSSGDEEKGNGIKVYFMIFDSKKANSRE